MNKNVQRKRDLRHLNPHKEAQKKYRSTRGKKLLGKCDTLMVWVQSLDFFFFKAGSVLFDFHESSSFLPVGGDVAFP